MKKTLKKILTLGITFAMLSAILLGCGAASEPTTVRVGSMKGPTSMGLMFLMEEDEAGKADNDYEFQMVTGADELLPLLWCLQMWPAYFTTRPKAAWQ